MSESINLLTTKEISNLFKVNRVTVTQWISGGKLQAIKTLGGYLRVPRSNLIQFLRENRMPLPEGLLPSRPTVVVVDDDPDTAEIIKRKITEAFTEARVEIAGDGVQALIKVGDLKPDALILDIMMPEMDGLEVIRRIKSDASMSGMKIIAISGHENKAASAMDAGADGFFSKRRRFEDLIKFLPECIPAFQRRGIG